MTNIRRFFSRHQRMCEQPVQEWGRVY